VRNDVVDWFFAGVTQSLESENGESSKLIVLAELPESGVT